MAKTPVERMRVACFIGWPDSMDCDAIDRRIEEAHCQGAKSPLHEKDAYDSYDLLAYYKRQCDAVKWMLKDQGEDGIDEWVSDWSEKLHNVLDFVPKVGDYKKSHYHYLVAFRGMKSVTQIRQALGLPSNHPVLKVEDKGGYLRYMCHLDNPDKVRYDITEIKPFGGIDLSALTSISEMEQMDYSDQITSKILSGGIRNMGDLVRWAMEVGDWQLRREVKRSAYYWRAILDSMREEEIRERGRLRAQQIDRDFERMQNPAQECYGYRFDGYDSAGQMVYSNGFGDVLVGDFT